MNNSNSTENSNMILELTVNSNSSTLNLPFEISDDPDIIKTTNTYLASMLKIECSKSEKYEDYLDKIKSNENKYFDIRNYKYIALNTLLLKQLMDIKIKLKEHITKIEFLFDNQWKTRTDLYNVQKMHKTQLFLYDQFFNEHASTSDRLYIDLYIRYLSGLFNQENIVINSSMILRYSIKINIEFETELKRREENLYNWKVDTYEDINTYYTFA
jgi:hypothetical protein